MSERFKSSLYLAAFILASILYYSETNTEEASQGPEMASADIEHVATDKAGD
ncbi:hypothetical protein [Pseudozobellia thermophila]|uniref:Uncharacterized protein n=1 Tax=Pseudozobellia thermophila TaxID=192903 RepID=A0A1M6NFV1_9FLAO|nr:hypothetical protein [Pseudozobellia thermophila]SHJ94638.1 hypothetical protein SAMN04488513_11346 [Pseudozobellia thermophila]